MTTAEAARILHRSPETVRRYARRAGIPLPLTADDVDYLGNYWAYAPHSGAPVYERRPDGHRVATGLRLDGSPIVSAEDRRAAEVTEADVIESWGRKMVTDIRLVRSNY